MKIVPLPQICTTRMDMIIGKSSAFLMRAKLKITYPNGLTDSMDIFYMFKFYLLFTIYQLEIFFLSVMMATLLNIHHS